jgi:Na+/H+ antiporter NhaC
VRRSGATLFFIIVSSAPIGSWRNLLGMLLALNSLAATKFCGRIRRQFSAPVIIGVILAAVAFFIADQSLVLLIGAAADRHFTEYKGSASRI